MIYCRAEAGGRDVPLDLGNERPSQYRPHLRLIGGSGEMLGVAFMNGPGGPVYPGGKAYATVKFLYEPSVSYAGLVEGSRFEILEGPRVIGHGEITRR